MYSRSRRRRAEHSIATGPQSPNPNPAVRRAAGHTHRARWRSHARRIGAGGDAEHPNAAERLAPNARGGVGEAVDAIALVENPVIPWPEPRFTTCNAVAGVAIRGLVTSVVPAVRLVVPRLLPASPPSLMTPRCMTVVASYAADVLCPASARPGPRSFARPAAATAAAPASSPRRFRHPPLSSADDPALSPPGSAMPLPLLRRMLNSPAPVLTRVSARRTSVKDTLSLGQPRRATAERS